MNKLRLITLLVLSAFILQNCKKDTATYTATSTEPLQATINGAIWTPQADSTSTTITYNAATKVKTLTCTGTSAQSRVNITLNLNNAPNTTGFRLGTYSVDASNNLVMLYSAQVKDAQGNYVFVPKGTTGPGSGVIVISGIDSVKNLITGSFNFLSRTPIYDGSGNVTSIYVASITNGEFNSLPYSFSTN